MNVFTATATFVKNQSAIADWPNSDQPPFDTDKKTAGREQAHFLT